MAKERVPTERIIECLRETNGLVSLAAKRVPCSISTINAPRKRVKAVQQVIDEGRLFALSVTNERLEKVETYGVHV